MALAPHRDGIDKDAYVAESLRVWKDDPTMSLGQLRKRRRHYHKLTTDRIHELGLEHEDMSLCPRRRRER